VASFMGCMNIVIFLIQNQASPDEATVRGETPLHLAARANQTDIIRILLRNGAKVDARARVSFFSLSLFRLFFFLFSCEKHQSPHD
jgi:ankyrin repeat protein